MASDLEVRKVLNSVKESARLTKSLIAVLNQALAYNSAQSISWNDLATSNPDMVSGGDVVDSSSDPISATPAEVSNALGSLDNLLNTWWATHGGNIQKLTNPIV